VARIIYWAGRLRPGGEAEHAAFLAFLRSPEGHDLLARYGLQRYTLARQGERIAVRFATASPPRAIGFLRNPRAWPEAWELDPEARGSLMARGLGPEDGEIEFDWSRPADAPVEVAADD
jgi:hypothetical protein